MTKKEVLENLCIRDPRNPDYEDAYPDRDALEPMDNCFCDNCFEGRSKLAVELLYYMDKEE